MKLKESTGNFSMPDDDISLVAYIVEHNDGQEANDDDYFEYQDAMDNANELIDKLSDNTKVFYNVEVASGYYDGIQIAVTNQGNDIFFLDESIDFSYPGILELDDAGIIDIDPELRKKLDKEVEDNGYGRTFEDADADFKKIMGESMNSFVERETEKKEEEAKAEIEAMLTELVDSYGWIRLGISARFSNGETIYSRVNESKSSLREGANNFSENDDDISLITSSVEGCSDGDIEDIIASAQKRIDSLSNETKFWYDVSVEGGYYSDLQIAAGIKDPSDTIFDLTNANSYIKGVIELVDNGVLKISERAYNELIYYTKENGYDKQAAIFKKATGISLKDFEAKETEKRRKVAKKEIEAMLADMVKKDGWEYYSDYQYTKGHFNHKA